MPQESSSSASSNNSAHDRFFDYEVAYETANAKKLEELLKRRHKTNKQRNAGRDRGNLFRSRNSAENEVSPNAFEKITLHQRKSPRSTKPQPADSPKASAAQTVAQPSTSRSFVVPDARVPLAKKIINSGQAVVRQMHDHLIRKTVPPGARVNMAAMTMSTPKPRHTMVNPFDNSVGLSPIRREMEASVVNLGPSPKIILEKISLDVEQPVPSVQPIQVGSPLKYRPSRDHQLSLTDEDEEKACDRIESSSRSSVEIEPVDQSMSIHDPPPKAQSFRSAKRTTLQRSSPRKNADPDQPVAGPSRSRSKNLLNTLLGDWSDGDDDSPKETPIKPKQVSFKRSVLVFESSDSEAEVSKPKPLTATNVSVSILKRPPIHDEERVFIKPGPKSKKKLQLDKKRAKDRSNKYNTIDFQSLESETESDTQKRSKEPPRSLKAIEQEVNKIYETINEVQEKPPTAPPQPEPERQSNGSSNDSVYYDTQKSPEVQAAVEPTPIQSPKPSTSAAMVVSPKMLRPSQRHRVPDSPTSDGSLMLTNDCENVRQSILSQEMPSTHPCKDDDVFAVPSQPTVLPKRGRPKKSQTSIAVPNFPKSRKKSKSGSSRDSTIKRRLFSQVDETNKSEEESSLSRRTSHSIPEEKGKSSDDDSPMERSKTRSTTRARPEQGKPDDNHNSPPKKQQSPRRSSNNVQTTPQSLPREFPRANTPASSDESWTARKPRPKKSKANQSRKTKGPRKAKKSKVRQHLDPQPSTSRGIPDMEAAPVDGSPPVLRRSTRERRPVPGMVPNAVYTAAWSEYYTNLKEANKAKKLLLAAKKANQQLAPIPEVVIEGRERSRSRSRERQAPPQNSTENPAAGVNDFISLFKDKNNRRAPQLLLTDKYPECFVVRAHNLQHYDKGEYDIFIINTDNVSSSGYICMHPFGTKPQQKIGVRQTRISLISGEVKVFVNGIRELTLCCGDTIYLANGCSYSVQNSQDTPAIYNFQSTN